MMMAYYMGGKEIEQKTAKENPRYEFLWLSAGEIFTPYAREMLAGKALELGADYLFSVDDDMMAPADLFYRLARHDVDIVAPLAFTRNPPHMPVIFSTVEGFDKVTRRNYSLNNQVKNYPRNRLVECDAVGFGAVLVKTEVFKKIQKPWFFGMPQTGEDVTLCVKAKKEGFRVFMDTATKLGHLSHPVIVTEEYSDQFNKLSLEEKNRLYGFYTKYAEEPACR